MPYTAIRSEGNLIPLDLLDRIAREDVPGQKAGDFGLPKGARLGDEIARAWSDAQDYWHVFRRRAAELPPQETGTSLTRERWMARLLNDLFAYDLSYQAAGVVIEGRNYPISHRAGQGEESPPVHIEGLRVDLDYRPESGYRRLSPQALVQDYLNRSEKQLWGIVANGLRLRLLRDTSRTSRPTYLEFDLESTLDGNRFTEFALFYRLCHRTRLPRTAEDAHRCLLEQYFQISIEQGGRVRDRLRDGVEAALKILGTGFLRHPGNQALRERIKAGTLAPARLHRQLLRLVYRLLFLMVAEERRMVVPEAAAATTVVGQQAASGIDPDRCQRLYDQFYSVARLRELTEHPIEAGTFGDLWLGLRRTFTLFSNGGGGNPLSIPPLNGDLFNSNPDHDDLRDTRLYNHDLLLAMRQMALFREQGVQQRINYAALDVEELGSVYESLLDFHPVVEERDEGPCFELNPGTERKSTGSYYTRPELVRELIESALVPVMQDRLAKAKTREENIQAILNIALCDPACGSGHFLLAAARRLGRELARARTGEEEPTPKDFHLAVRDVIAHCIYGVDLNPLAVDLCKLALWLEGHWTGKPLSFLDHRIKCGNSLVGVFDLKMLAEGIPDDAYKAVTGDDKPVAAALKKRNKKERTSPQASLKFDSRLLEDLGPYAEQFRKLTALGENSPADVKRKAELYSQMRSGGAWWRNWVGANLWTAGFFTPMTERTERLVPTHEDVQDYLASGRGKPQTIAAAQALAVERGFFHWPLEFPEVFAGGGFDAVLGNPPWERIKLQEEEFFAVREPEIAHAPNKAARQRLIDQLPRRRPELAAEFAAAKHAAEAGSRFVRTSERFPLTAVGDVNTYALFAELARNLINQHGSAGVLIPTGIATDDTCKQFFSDLNERRALSRLYDFENREAIFPAVHRSYKFCLLTVTGKRVKEAEFAFFCTRTEHLRDQERRFSLAPDDLALLNPNTRTCPVFRTRTDADLTKEIYRRVPVLVNEATGENPWGVKFLAMFHMSNDSGLFSTEPGEGLVPLYEGKMVQAFDHRAASVITNTANIKRPGQAVPTEKHQYDDWHYAPKPQYWVEGEAVRNSLPTKYQHRWFIGFKSVTSPTNERTFIATLLPFSGVANSMPLILTDQEPLLVCCLLGNLNALVFDYVAKQKVGGVNLNFFIIEQLPLLPPGSYSETARQVIADRALELLYTARDLTAFARDIGYQGEPFRWDEDRRALLRAELDAYYALLYGLTRDELRYILDPKDVYGADFPGETFRVLKENEIRKYGEYRTRRLVLEAYDSLATKS